MSNKQFTVKVDSKKADKAYERLEKNKAEAIKHLEKSEGAFALVTAVHNKKGELTGFRQNSSIVLGFGDTVRLCTDLMDMALEIAQGAAEEARKLRKRG
jgi:glucosamine 6-phosphate synthetase-like amidotransferase/phosphosugar isomerase protein